MLEIRNLHAAVDGKAILRGISLDVAAGEVHAIMGPNGSGKSTLAYLLAGREDYTVTEGEILFDGHDLLALDADERARAGLFLGFQYPVEIPGVGGMNFVKSAVNAVRVHRGLDELDAIDFLKLARKTMKLLEIEETLLSRPLNVGFSGGEKKRNEVFQMAMLEPRLAILDETDSGLDVDALKIVAKGINAMRGGDRAIVLITHYQRLLNYVVPDHVHVLADGRFVKSAGKELALEIEDRGYAALGLRDDGVAA